MNGMTAFLVAAGALLIIALGILLRPLLRTPNTAVSSVDRRRANRQMLAAKSIRDLVDWSGGLYNPPARFRNW